MRLLRPLAELFAMLCFAVAAFGADGSSFKPPPGANVAIVLFEDLECPDCARAYPVVWEAASAQKVPVMQYDFPLSKHRWSFEAAVYARFFDTKSRKLGNDFRGFVYKSQADVTPQNLRQFAQKFADDNKVTLPFVVDAEGKLKAKVKADYELGECIGLEHVPTIFVVGNGGGATPFVEVADYSQLTQTIGGMKKKAAEAAPANKTVP